MQTSNATYNITLKQVVPAQYEQQPTIFDFVRVESFAKPAHYHDVLAVGQQNGSLSAWNITILQNMNFSVALSQYESILLPYEQNVTMRQQNLSDAILHNQSVFELTYAPTAAPTLAPTSAPTQNGTNITNVTITTNATNATNTTIPPSLNITQLRQDAEASVIAAIQNLIEAQEALRLATFDAANTITQPARIFFFDDCIVDGFSSPQFYDFDRNGAMDIVVADQEGEIDVWVSDYNFSPTPQPTPQSGVPTPFPTFITFEDPQAPTQTFPSVSSQILFDSLTRVERCYELQKTNCAYGTNELYLLELAEGVIPVGKNISVFLDAIERYSSKDQIDLVVSNGNGDIILFKWDPFTDAPTVSPTYAPTQSPTHAPTKKSDRGTDAQPYA